MRQLAAALLFGSAVIGSTGCARGIESSGYVALGGIEQWVTVRGDDAANPLLLVVHGGPGDVLSPHIAAFEPYEADFTVVQWDQRGAGRTYGRYREQTPDLSLDRVAADGVELAEHLRNRFEQDRIVLLGHSWGSVVGVEMAKRRPDLFSAFVGTGQVASWALSVREQFDFVRRRAEERADPEALGELASIRPLDPRNLEQFLTIGRHLRSYLNEPDAAWLASLRARAQAHYTTEELEDVGNGMSFSGRALIATQMDEDLFATARRLEVPIGVIQGSDDLFTPTAPAIAWFEHVEAPSKTLRIIDGAGHFALVTHPAEFVAALREMRDSMFARRDER